jgi:hypothetical protein
MRAARGTHVELSFAITTYRQFGEAAAENAAFAALASPGGFELARQDVFGEVLHGGHVFLDEVAKSVDSFTAGVVKLLPGARFLENEIGYQ